MSTSNGEERTQRTKNAKGCGKRENVGQAAPPPPPSSKGRLLLSPGAQRRRARRRRSSRAWRQRGGTLRWPRPSASESVNDRKCRRRLARLTLYGTFQSRSSRRPGRGSRLDLRTETVSGKSRNEREEHVTHGPAGRSLVSQVRSARSAAQLTCGSARGWHRSCRRTTSRRS